MKSASYTPQNKLPQRQVDGRWCTGTVSMLALTAAVAMDRARLSVVARHNRGSESDFEAIEKAGVVMRPSAAAASLPLKYR